MRKGRSKLNSSSPSLALREDAKLLLIRFGRRRHEGAHRLLFIDSVIGRNFEQRVVWFHAVDIRQAVDSFA